MKNILEEAAKIVYERSEEKTRQYGPPRESFERAAKISTVITGKTITATDVIKIQMALKLSRETHAHKEDNLLDLVAYTSILNDIENENSNH